MATRIPPLLEPYLSLPPETSLILLTNILGASTNWLVLRYLHICLQPRRTGGSDIEPKVVLVSFLRDLAFWKDGSRKLGLDLSKLTTQKRFTFVDGLSELFSHTPTTALPEKPGETVLRSAELAKVYENILSAIRSLKSGESGDGGGRVVLIIDSLDLLLAATGKDVGPVQLCDMILDLREQVHSTILTLSGDGPLVSRQQTPLEINHATFLLSIAHQANLTMSLRLLDTGLAKDVSGVIRIGSGEQSKGGEYTDREELLYFVGGDGSVRVFERGQ